MHPNTKKKNPQESTELAECIGDARDLLRRILAEDLQTQKLRASLTEHQSMRRYRQMREAVLHECHATFRTCFHAFYPTGHLKWWCLCDLLCQMEPVGNMPGRCICCNLLLEMKGAWDFVSSFSIQF